jgi:phosphodiesterase/alkaline phosphatase D-like protein
MLTISDEAPTAYVFQYGKSRNYGRTTEAVMKTASALVSVRLKHLAAHTRYYYRLTTVSDGQTTHGNWRSFVTMGRKAHKTSRHK